MPQAIDYLRPGLGCGIMGDGSTRRPTHHAPHRNCRREGKDDYVVMWSGIRIGRILRVSAVGGRVA
jgi:hypothetical protein